MCSLLKVWIRNLLNHFTLIYIQQSYSVVCYISYGFVAESGIFGGSYE